MTAGAVIVPTIVPLRPPIPGQHKSYIDTNTKIELSSETPNVTIYYTINGSKPEPFQPLSPAGKSTFKYRQPFRLPGGKKTIKALAVAVDGIRESHVVSKTFDVEAVEPDYINADEDGLDFVKDIPGDVFAQKAVKKFGHSMVTSKEAWAELQKLKDKEQMMDDMATIGSNRRKAPTGARFMNSRLGTTKGSLSHTMASTNGLGGGDLGESLQTTKRLAPPDTATQAMRLQRETDFMKCVYCFAPRPADPYARFCNECGNPVPPLPQTRIAPPEPGQLTTCVHCKSMVPANAPTCLVCESPMAPQNIPQATIKLTDKLVCDVCGTANPATMTSCVTCENRLPYNAKAVPALSLAPPRPGHVPEKTGNDFLTCSKCGRVNNPDARFCDWCGTKPAAPGASLTCHRCSASNQPYAHFCASCGTIIEPPMRQELKSAGLTVSLQKTNNNSSQWMPVTVNNAPVPKSTIATQTVGFYPSQNQLVRKNEEEEEKLALEKQMRDRKPLLTAVSPGRGYWRKQMEHVCMHLKAQAQNNAEFRALIAEPRMGKIISTAVHEDGYELSLSVNFALRGNKDPFAGDRLGVTQRDPLSSYTEGRWSSHNRAPSPGEESMVSTPGRKTKKKVTKKKKNKEIDRLSDENKKLLKEVGKNGEGLPSEIQQLIDEGADPNCKNKDGFPVLFVAVQNKQVDAIPVLVQEGADINEKGPNKGYTPLHEAVALGNAGMEVIDALMGCGANPRKKNDKGESAYDLAVKSGYDSIGKKLAANLGQSALDKLMKPKSTADMF